MRRKLWSAALIHHEVNRLMSNTIEENRLYNMDCLECFRLLPDNSIDMVITSPPYDDMRSYKGFHLDLHATGVEIARVFKEGGVCVMVMQDRTKNWRKSGTTFRTIAD